MAGNATFNWRTSDKRSRMVEAREDGFYTRHPISFVFGCDGRQCSYDVSAGTPIVGKFDRAKMVREEVRLKRKGNWYASQEAYVGALRADRRTPSPADLAILYCLRALS